MAPVKPTPSVRPGSEGGQLKSLAPSGVAPIPGDEVLVLVAPTTKWGAEGRVTAHQTHAAARPAPSTPAATAATAADTRDAAEALTMRLHTKLDDLRAGARSAATLAPELREARLRELHGEAIAAHNDLQGAARQQLGPERAADFLKTIQPLVQTQQQLKALTQPGLDNSTGSWREQAQKAIDGLGKSLAKDGEERTIAIREVQDAVHENVKDIPFLGNAIDRRMAMIGTLAINTAGVESMAGMVMQDGGPKQLAIGLATMVGNALAHPVDTAIAVNEAYSEASAKRGRAAVDMEIALNLVGLVYGGAKLVNGLRKGAPEAADASKAMKGSEIANTTA